jgi:molybdopterin/thiamine biosynthesis adenylyltransferase
MSDLDDEKLLRYSRQIFLPEIDVEGQQRLLGSTVMILGLGGLGAPAAIYLASSGIGRLILVDPDHVELSNLQRQIIHDTSSLGSSKVHSAAGRLKSLNPGVSLEKIDRALTQLEMEDMLRRVDVVVDGTDNLDARFLANRACHATGTPLVSGAVARFEGQVSVFSFEGGKGPCYQCLYKNFTEQAANCSESGVLGSVAGIVGCVQATETIKQILGIGRTLHGRFMILDAKNMDWRTLLLDAEPDCEVCSPG